MQAPYSKFIVCSAVAVLSALPQPARCQAPSDTGIPKKFALSASVTERPSLSRSDIDKMMIGLAPTGVGGGDLTQPPADPYGYSNAPVQTRRHVVPPGTAPSVSPYNGSTQDALGQSPVNDSYLTEYNVNWRQYISTVADRWFYILRSAEFGLGMQFHSPRPALIQFTCYPNGSIGNIILKQSSGVPVYDHLQIQALMASAPLPAFPAGTQRQNLTLVQGWESHPAQDGERDYQFGSFGTNFPQERVRKWMAGR